MCPTLNSLTLLWGGRQAWRAPDLLLLSCAIPLPSAVPSLLLPCSSLSLSLSYLQFFILSSTVSIFALLPPTSSLNLCLSMHLIFSLCGPFWLLPLPFFLELF